MTTDEHDERSLVIPVFLEFLLGVGLALVLTPKSGRQFRGDLRRDLNRGVRRAKDTVEETVELLKEQGQLTTAHLTRGAYFPYLSRAN